MREAAESILYRCAGRLAQVDLVQLNTLLRSHVSDQTRLAIVDVLTCVRETRYPPLPTTPTRPEGG